MFKIRLVHEEYARPRAPPVPLVLRQASWMSLIGSKTCQGTEQRLGVAQKPLPSNQAVFKAWRHSAFRALERDELEAERGYGSAEQPSVTKYMVYIFVNGLLFLCDGD